MSTPQDGTLQAWRQSRGLSLAKAAAELGIPGVNAAETLRRYEAGIVWPRPEVLDRILSASNGAVTVEAMLSVRLARPVTFVESDPAGVG